MIQTTDLVTHRKATEIARVYAKTTTEIRELLLQLSTAVNELETAFSNESGYSSDFRINLEHHSTKYALQPHDIDQIIGEFKRAAWSVLVKKLDIEKLMSSKKQQELRENLHYHNHRNSISADQLPEITEESILSVLSGYLHSADELLEEKIREEFDWLRPTNYNGGQYKTNKKFEVGRKVIKSYCVESGYSSAWKCCYHNESHLIALDSIFHLLDGKGIPAEHKGQLVSAIHAAGPDGKGETAYFRFKCHKNHNIHIEFLRDDLLAEFNRRAGRSDRIGTH